MLVIAGSLLPDDGVELTRVGVDAEVVELERRGNRKDDVGELSVVLHPRMLDQIELEVWVHESVLELIAAVPAGGPARSVRPDHLDAVVAVLRELEFLELVGAVMAARSVTVPRDLLAFLDGDALRHERLRNKRRGKLAEHGAVVAGAHLRQEVSRRQRIEGVHADESPLDELHLVATRLADRLHGEQIDLETRRLMGVRRADVGTTVAVADGNVVRRPVASKRLDAVGGNVALLLSPLGRLRNAVLVAEHVVLEPVEAIGVRGDVLLVVRALGDPHVGNGELHGRIGVREDGDPHVGVNRVRIVHVGGDVDLLHADLGEPEAQAARLLARPAPRRRLGIAAPEQHGIGVLGDILEQIVLMRVLTERLVAPGVLGAPVPAFPRVRLARLHSQAARHVEQVRHRSVGTVDGARLAMAVALAEDGVAAVGLIDTHDLGGDDVGRLVPGDALVL